MGSWGSGPGMIEEPELEEGEACDCKDDPRIDPDITLSYIGEKVQSILGHLQRDFEGGVSAENLGAKFGGYGSFLPTQPRSPAISSQPKSARRIQNPSSRSPDHLFPKARASNSAIVSDALPPQGNGSASPCSMRPTQTLKVFFDDASMTHNASLSSNQVSEASHWKVRLPSSKSINPMDQRRPKVHSKMGSERMAQYRAAIYNLGLMSPSSSAENSPDKTSSESPANILEIMTSFPVSSGLLLSPLCEDLVNLIRETESSTKIEHEAACKSSAISDNLLNNDAVRGKKAKSVNKSENFKKSKDGSLVGLNDCKQKSLENEALKSRVQPSHDLHCQTLSDTVREEKVVQVKKRKERKKDKVKGRVSSSDLVKDVSLMHTSHDNCGKYEQQGCRSSSVEKHGKYCVQISHKEVLVDHRHSSKSTGKKESASSQSFLDISEGERNEVAMDCSSLEVGMKATSNYSGNKLYSEGKKKSKGCQTRGNLASEFTDSLIGGSSAAQKNKYGGKKDVHNRLLSQKGVLDKSLKHVDNLNHLLGWPSGDRPKNSTLEAAKAKLGRDDKLKEGSCKDKYFDKMTSEAYLTEPPPAAVPSNEGIMPGLELTVVAPVVIQEDWVACDHCQKWRLLPYGTKSEQLPDKWACSMLDWLPGMNRCEISEDETTNAIQALYLVPVPENQCNYRASAGKTMPGVSAAGVDLDWNHQNFAPDQVRKQKQKEKLNKVSMNNTDPTSDDKKNLHWSAVKNDSSKEVNHSIAEVNAASKFIVKQPNKSLGNVAKLSKQKGGPEIEDNENPRKKSKKESVQHADGLVEKIRYKDAVNVDNHQISGQNLGSAGHSVASGLSNKAASKEGKKRSAKKDAVSGAIGNLKIHVKNQTDLMQDLPDIKCTGTWREASAKKRKFRDCEDSQQQEETQPDSRGNLQDRKVTMTGVSKDSAFQQGKKSRVSQIEEGPNTCKVDDTSKRKCAEARTTLLRSKEYPVNRGIEKEQQLRKFRVKGRLTIEDIDELRKDLEFEQLPTAAASSSSKVSDSRNNRIHYMEVKSSPAESVSSSPARTTYPDQVSLMTMETVGKFDSRLNDAPAINSVKKSLDIHRSSELLLQHNSRKNSSLGNNNTSLCTSEVRGKPSTYIKVFNSGNKLKEETNANNNYRPPQYEVLSDRRHPLSDESSIISVKDSLGAGSCDIGRQGDNRSDNQSTQAESGRTDVNVNKDLMESSTEQTSTRMEPRNAMLRIDLRQGGKQVAVRTSKYVSGPLVSLKRFAMDSRSLDDSVVGGTSKALKDVATARHKKSTDRDGVEQSVAEDESLANKSVPTATASTALKKAEGVLKEAEDLRIHADLIKNSGFGSESNYEYFKAAIKFLQGASLLEACNGGSNKHLGMNPMQIYGTAAKLCKICAFEYEKGYEMAAAALAFKCMEVAYLRIAFCKSLTMSRICRHLKSSQQMVLQGESPVSSASDVDNLNNLASVDKAVLSKGNDSDTGNHVIVPHNRPNFVQLLNFTKDVNSAMEAARKSHDALAAALVKLEDPQNKDGIVSVKRVIDFSFQNVEGLICLAWHAFNTIFSQGLGGDNE